MIFYFISGYVTDNMRFSSSNSSHCWKFCVVSTLHIVEFDHPDKEPNLIISDLGYTDFPLNQSESQQINPVLIIFLFRYAIS
jgi:hypothetical protein